MLLHAHPLGIIDRAVPQLGGRLQRAFAELHAERPLSMGGGTRFSQAVIRFIPVTGPKVCSLTL